MARATGVAPEQLRALGRLKRIEGIARFYLAGGTAIAFHLDHRRSVDLDLFGPGRASFAPFQRLAAKDPAHVQVVRVGEATLQLEVGGVPTDVVRYPYPLLERPVVGPSGFRTAGLLDLATNKLAAIARRGLRRDFWDLYEIARAGVTLDRACEAYVARFGVAESDLYHVHRGLLWFDDAEKVMPVGLTTKRWTTIRRYFEREVPRLVLGRR